MAANKITRFVKRAAKAKREEQVVDAYQELLGIRDLPRPFGSDGLADDTLFEAKLDLAMTKDYARCLAQATYYIRRIVHNGVDKGITYSVPKRIVICDRNEALVVSTDQVKPFVYADEFDWSRPPSSPDEALVKEIYANVESLIFDTTAELGVTSFLEAYAAGGEAILQEITAQNFVAVFEVWCTKFSTNLSHQESAMAYMLDLQKLGVFRNGKLRLSGDPDQSGRAMTMDISADEDVYREFWSIYRRPPTTEEFSRIVARKDRLVAITQRRTTGEFFTPGDVAKRAHEYLCRAAVEAGLVATPEELYEKAYWWDCCAGSGNLIVDCPAMPNRLFASTLEKEDIEHMRLVGLHPEAELFQLDFLNDVDFPESVRTALADVGRPWVVLINPPFSAGVGETHGNTKTGVSSTQVQKTMPAGFGTAKQNLLTQFMWHLNSFLPKDALLGFFADPAFMTGDGFEEFYTTWLSSWRCLGGFTEKSARFSGTNGNWPVAFSIYQRKADV